MNRALRTHGAPETAGARGKICSGWGSRRPPGDGLGDIRGAITVRDHNRAPRPAVAGYRRGFTLLEMVIVLVVIAILAAMSIPAFSSAVNEHRVREDAHQVAMMIRQAMLQSGEQHRTFFVDLNKNTITLHAEGEQAPDADTDAKLFGPGSGGTETNADIPITETVSQPAVDEEKQIDPANKLQIPDPNKADAWIDLPDDGQEWTFQPGQLCPATKVRLVRGDAYLELDFAALTGGVETEKYYFP
jgi:prepilin-type N-terminal cleavage/methylation domain-containing protein